jgi:F-type H+-transporting ATPase subunit b
MRAFLFVLFASLVMASGSARADVKSTSDSKAKAPVPTASSGGEHKAGDAGGHGAHQGEFEPFGWSVDTALFSFFVFAGLILVLQRFAWKPIMEALDEREKTLQKASDDAAKARAEAASLRSELDEKLAQAGDQVRQMVDEARRDGQNLREEMLGRAREEIAAERERLHRDLETAKDQALQEISLRSVKLASLLTSKVLGRQVSEPDHSRLLDEAIADLDRSMAVPGVR